MARYDRLLIGAQWEKIRPLVRRLRSWRAATRFRPQGARRYFVDSAERARWRDLFEEFAPVATCWRRMREWEEQYAWVSIWRAFLAELNKRKQLQ